MSQTQKDIWLMALAHEVAHASRCWRQQVGAIITRDNLIIATGYNGVARGELHCGACQQDAGAICQATHAEMNAIIAAARLGHHTDGASMYCTLEPCHKCASAIINAGIKMVIVSKKTAPATINSLGAKILTHSVYSHIHYI